MGSKGDARSNFEELNSGDHKSFIDITIDKVATKDSKDLILGTVTGWIAGVAIIKVGRIAAFGLGGGIIILHFASERGLISINWDKVKDAARQSQGCVDRALMFMKRNSYYSVGLVAKLGGPTLATSAAPDQDMLPPQEIPKPLEPYKPMEEPKPFLDKPSFLPSKPMSHSPKISPSSIPNPSPSVSTNKPMDPGYPNYGGYLYSIPGYSAFQPVSYPGMLQPSQTPLSTDSSKSDFLPYQSLKETPAEKMDTSTSENLSKVDIPKSQTDFEEQFTPEIVPAVSAPETKTQVNESKMCITSLAQGSGATVTIPSQTTNKDPKKKLPERFSLKTSIPISKIDIKCMTNPDPILHNAALKKPSTFNPAFQTTKCEPVSKVEIQSNIVIKSAGKDETTSTTEPNPTTNNINTLINAAEAISKSETQFRKPEPKADVINEIKDPPPPNFNPSIPISRPLFNPINLDGNKANFPPKATEGNFNEQKNQILFIQNKNNTNPKMLLTIQQQTPQVLLQRTNAESKNLQAPSRLSSQSKKSKEEIVENGTSSKVVALKRLHQENCDENDFENLITENQIYGNKIVVKEKSQGTQQEQDLKNKKMLEKTSQPETKNVVLQPNFVYLSNVQFPANLMMIKNNSKISQSDANKVTKITPNENKVTNEVSTMTNTNDANLNTKNPKTQTVTVSKEIHVLKSSNNVLQTLSNKSTKPDLVFQTPHQKVIMNPQIVYQVPMIVDRDTKLNQPFINNEYSKFIGQNKKDQKQFEQKANDKLFIACPYQVDSKLQPKIVITNIRPKISKIEEVSSLDIYEKRKRMRRLKYLSNREVKDIQKVDLKKSVEKTEGFTNVITPDKMKAEICKEFAKTKIILDEGSSDSENDYEEDDLDEYNTIIKEYSYRKDNDEEKIKFLAHFRLGTHDLCKDKEMERQERAMRRDSVASAYIAAGRLDCLTKETTIQEEIWTHSPVKNDKSEPIECENRITLQRKQIFLSHLKLTQVTAQYRESYEETWQEILKERKRRNGVTEPGHILLKQPKLKCDNNLELDPNNQLQILTEIKKSVNDNNNLIKKRLDSTGSESPEGDSIHTLAEKNISELNRLSKMADRSVKLITGQNTRKRDLNPGFDSENIQKPVKIEQPFQNYPHINIPNISKIISLKSNQDQKVTQTVTSQATSMDEPKYSAAGVQEMFDPVEKSRDFSCQVEEALTWPGLEALVKVYKEYDAVRKKEINELHRRNTALRVEGAHITRAASRHSDCARALLAERQKLASEEANVRASLQRLCSAIEFIKNS